MIRRWWSYSEHAQVAKIALCSVVLPALLVPFFQDVHKNKRPWVFYLFHVEWVHNARESQTYYLFTNCNFFLNSNVSYPFQRKVIAIEKMGGDCFYCKLSISTTPFLL